MVRSRESILIASFIDFLSLNLDGFAAGFNFGERGSEDPEVPLS